MISLLFILACTEETPLYDDLTSRDEVDVVEPASEPSTETGLEETGEPDIPEETDATMTFRAPLLNCTEIQKRTMTLTRVMPAGLDTEGSSEALFYNEVLRAHLGTSNLEFSQTEGLDDCIFSISLPTPASTDFTSIVIGEDANGNPKTIPMAMYYPATFVNQNVACETPTLSESNNQKVSCISTFDVAATPDPSGEVSNALLVSGDIYDWGSPVLPVFVDNHPEGAFEDLGFKKGWNLAQFSDGEMILIESIDNLDQLSEVVFDNRGFLPRYQINGLGSISAEADFGNEFSIDLLPAQWFNDNDTVETGVSMYIQDSEISWSIEVWGQPGLEQFFGLSFPAESSYYQQWSSEVDVAAFVPVVFPGEPSQYDSGIPAQGTDIAIDDTRLGAVCKDSSTLAFTFLREPRRPSEIYWYSLVGHNPGWYAQYGTDGIPSSWRMVLENTDTTSPYTYSSLSIGNGCQVPEGWQ